MTRLLEGKVVYFVGGGADICKPVVIKFVEEGAKTVVLDINPQKLKFFENIEGVIPIQGDATTLKDNEKAVNMALNEFGRLDILVGCAGITDFRIRIWRIPREALSEAFDEIFSVNVKSYILAARVSVEELMKNRGNMIFTVSNAGFYPDGGGVLYTASKFAVRGLVTQLAFELAPLVRVNGVAPGGTPTDLSGPKALRMEGRKLRETPMVEERIRRMLPLQIVPRPEDYVWAYLYLASDKLSRTVTGHIIEADGGIGIRGILQPVGTFTSKDFKEWADVMYEYLRAVETLGLR